MRTGTRSLLAFTALAFAVLFIAVAVAQAVYVNHELNTFVAHQLQSWTEEIREEVKYRDGWDLRGYRRSSLQAPHYFVVTTGGEIIDVEGFIPGILSHVSGESGWPAGHPVTIVAKTGEQWRLFLRKLLGGTVVLGIPTSEAGPDVDIRLRENSERFGADIAKAIMVKPRDVDSTLDFAVIDEIGVLRNAEGGIPITIEHADQLLTEVGVTLVNAGGQTYAALSGRILDSHNQVVAVTRVFDDVTGEQRMQRDVSIFNFAVAAVSLIATVLFIVSGLLPRSFGEKGQIPCHALLSLEESDSVEFKSSLKWDYQLAKDNQKVLALSIAKTVAAFLNTEGGSLLIGVGPEKQVLGLERDYKCMSRDPNRDGWERTLQQVLRLHIGDNEYAKSIHIRWCSIQDKDVCVVEVRSATRKPVYVQETPGEYQIYRRVGNATRALSPKEAIEFDRDNRTIWRTIWPS